jgi:hypothetical protein
MNYYSYLATALLFIGRTTNNGDELIKICIEDGGGMIQWPLLLY